EAAALHVNAGCDAPPPPPNDLATANFQCDNGTTTAGQSVYVTGDNATLGNWAPANAIKLEPTNYPSWTGSIELPAQSTVEWKCIKRSEQDPQAQLVWQSGANNVMQTGSAGSTTATSGSF
ncbi:carbohydrate-binding module family 20 domain-containing protein, partial [Marinobacter alexandrii]